MSEKEQILLKKNEELQEYLKGIHETVFKRFTPTITFVDAQQGISVIADERDRLRSVLGAVIRSWDAYETSGATLRETQNLIYRFKDALAKARAELGSVIQMPEFGVRIDQDRRKG